MTEKKSKADKILDVAIELLKQEGDFALTMRRVALQTDMSLSNVQYYFKTKDELLTSMADRYFQQCLAELGEYPCIDSREGLHQFIRELLVHGHELSDMCRIFREYWAISTRNSVIDDYLMNFYQSLVNVVSDILRPLAHDEASLTRTVSILVPFVEGYSITARALPRDLDSMVASIEALLWDQLSSASD
ncbi:TetR/AcrR family transcriptional regulator [Vibrio sp. WXL103]|uniref:TetR/AcrR family transcriptional regulator n=1 Tax=unclassified Vibrio TaxID=2614977 RepID=UPI003EC4ADD8